MVIRLQRGFVNVLMVILTFIITQVILEKVLRSERVVKRWRDTEILIIDEVSMLSLRTFEIIHFIAQGVRKSKQAFGGVQIVASGDFKQLPPVSSSIDPGRYCFESLIWEKCFPHLLYLDRVMRQTDIKYLDMLNEIAEGECCAATEAFIKELSRPIDREKLGVTGHIPEVYSHNEDVDFVNTQYLNKIENQVRVFVSQDIGSKCLLDKQVQATRTLPLKVGARVMLICNINESLTNGEIGEIIKFAAEDGLPIVNFPEVGLTQKVEKVVWKLYDKDDFTKVKAERYQVPLKLAWAFTVHKAQGMTLDAVKVNVSGIFAPGHLYVALSRVRCREAIQVVGFRKSKIIALPQCVKDFSTRLLALDNGTHLEVNNLACCREETIKLMYSNNEETLLDDVDDLCDDVFSEQDIRELDQIVNGFFDQEIEERGTEEEVDLREVLENLSFEQVLSKPPETFYFLSFISALKNTSFLAKQPHSLAYRKNTLFDAMLTPDCIDSGECFVKILWNRLHNCIRKALEPHRNETLKRKYFRAHFSDVHLLILSSELEKEFLTIFGIPQSQKKKEHWSCLTDIAFAINATIIHEASKATSDHIPTQAPVFVDVNSLPVEMQGKIRYCGGWALAKTRDNFRRYIKENLFSSKESLQGRVKECYVKKKAVDSLSSPSSSIHSSSAFPETLTITDRRQYSKGGLTHITDSAHKFFLALEEKRIQLMNSERLKLCKSNLVSSAMNIAQADNRLLETWNGCLSVSCDEDTTQALTVDLRKDIFDNVVERYFKMGAGQFLRDFRRDNQIQRTEAHRKRVADKAKKDDAKKSKITIQEVKEDKSEGKVVTHKQLQALCTKHPKVFESRLYTKNELAPFFAAYGIIFRSSFTKARLNEILTAEIMKHNFIPNIPALG